MGPIVATFPPNLGAASKPVQHTIGKRRDQTSDEPGCAFPRWIPSHSACKAPRPGYIGSDKGSRMELSSVREGAMVEMDIVGVTLLAALLAAASHGAKAQWLPTEGAHLLAVGASGASSSDSAGALQGNKVTASATVSAHASASVSASASSSAGAGACNASASAEAEARAGNEVVQRSAQKRTEQAGSGCSASAHSSAEAKVSPAGPPPPAPGPQH